MIRVSSLRSNSFSFWRRHSTSRTKMTASSKLVTWYELTLVRNNSRPSSEGRRPTSISKSVDNALAVPWYGRDTATVQPLYSFRWTLASDLVVQEYKPGWRQNSHPLTLMLVLLAFHPRSCVTTSSTDDVDLRSPQPGVQLVISRKPWLTRYP